MEPLICITMHTVRPAAGAEQLTLSRAYAAAVAAAGGVPILAAGVCPKTLARRCGGLVLTGGGDVAPARYGESPLQVPLQVDPDRDAFEYSLTRAFLVENKPVLGICRGCQVINCLLGGSLYQDLPEQMGVIHMNGGFGHEILCREDAVLARLFGRRFQVNSTHHQAVRKLAPGLRITAMSLDGVVEAFEAADPGRLLWGVQFHPERMTGQQWAGCTPDMAALFALFVKTACLPPENRGCLL